MDVLVNFDYREDDVRRLFNVEDLVELVLSYEDMPATCEVSVSFVDNDEIHKLNRDFRGVDRPTDVLSFECDGISGEFEEDRELEEGEPFELGDVVVAVDVAQRQAPEYAMSFADEMSLLVTHGLLHLCGYDHMEEGDAEQMEAREVELLTEFWGRPFKRHGLDD